MSTPDSAGERLLKLVRSVNGESIQESQRAYSNWADTYEKDYLELGYCGHVLVSDCLCKKFLPESRPDVRVLDVGAGTGLVAEQLRKHGFLHIDALDPNENMLNKARGLKLYEKYFQMFITGEPSAIPADSYDAITASGIFGERTHVPCEALNEMIRLVKPGGYVALSSRHIAEQQCKSLEPLMNQLESEGKWKKEFREIRPRYYLDIDGVVWCYKVL